MLYARIKKADLENGEIDIEAYKRAMDNAEDIKNSLETIKGDMNSLIFKLKSINESRAAEYLRMYAYNHIDQIIKVLDEDTIETLYNEIHGE